VALGQKRLETPDISHNPFNAWNASLVVFPHDFEVACALKQTFAQCTIFLEGTLLITDVHPYDTRQTKTGQFASEKARSNSVQK